MVNITIDSHDPFEKILFKAVDQELSTAILLNNSLSIELMPSKEPNVAYNVTLTPPGNLDFGVIPFHAFSCSFI